MPTMSEWLDSQANTTSSVAGALVAADANDPEQAAKALQQAREAGLPPSVMGGAPDPDIARTQRLNERKRALESAPKLASWLEKQAQERPYLVSMVQDDLHPLSALDTAIATAKQIARVPNVARYRLAEAGFGIAAAAPGVASDIGSQGALPLAASGITGALLRKAFKDDTATYLQAGNENPFAATEQFFLDLARGQRLAAEQAEGNRAAMSAIERGVYGGLESFAMMAPGMAASIATRNPTYALAYGGGLAGGQAYAQAREEGVSPTMSAAFGLAQGGTEAVFERLPLLKALGDLKAGDSLAKMFLKNLAREVPTEQATTLVQDFNEWAIINPEKTLNEYASERPERALETLVATVTATGANTAFMKAIDMAAGVDQEARSAEELGVLLGEIQALSAATATLERDTETFEGFLQSVSDGETLPEFLYIDGNTLTSSGLAQKLIELSPSVAEQAALIQTGTMIRIPTAEVMGRFNQDLQPLLPDLRRDPNGMTQREAQSYVAENEPRLKSLIDRLLSSGMETDEQIEGREYVRQTISDELTSQAGVAKPVADQYATLVSAFYGTMAKRTGSTARTLFDERRIRVLGEDVEQNAELRDFQELAQLGKTQEFSNWFGLSKVINDAGEPIVLYHGTSKDKDFTAFNIGRRGAWFTTDPEEASKYASENDSQNYIFRNGEFVQTNTASRVIPAYVKIENPYVMTPDDLQRLNVENYAKAQAEFFDQLKARGYDGVKMSDTTWVVLGSNTQIKSTMNRGTYDAKKANMLYQRAFHGTPARGITKFSTDFIGTGEGAQSFGWGLYFASRREISEWYRSKLTFTDDQPRELLDAEGNKLKISPTDQAEAVAQWQLKYSLRQKLSDKYQEGRDIFEDSIDNAKAINDSRLVELYKSAIDVLNRWEASGVKLSPINEGQLYEVEIPEDNELLNWDKPLSEQPEMVREAFIAVYGQEEYDAAKDILGFGRKWYRLLSKIEGNDKTASQYLASLGIKGIRYLDGGSRADGEGTYNYVIFSGDDVSITEEFYQPGYHGTSVRGIRQFDTRFIGTGTGQKSYGWGLYFASVRDIAEYYRDMALLRARGEEGQVYAVEVPEDNEMLDWGANLSNQPKPVRMALLRAMGRDPKKGEPEEWRYTSGGELYTELSALQGGDQAASEFLLNAGIKGSKYLNANKSYNFVVFSGADVQVTGEFYQSVDLRRGVETLAAYGLDPRKKWKTREVAAALEARQRALFGEIDPKDRSDETASKIAEWMVAEVLFAMENPASSGVGWYSKMFQTALDIMGDVYPELKTDKAQRNVMTALIAITSDGQKVVPNFAQAMDIYGRYRPGGETEGRFTTRRGTARQASVDAHLEKMQRLIEQFGSVEEMTSYLLQEETISELKKIAKANGGTIKSSYQAHIKMPMAAIEFGPKLGAFYANLMGAHGYLTMDRWWSRSFNRYRGTLLQEPTRQGLDRFKRLMTINMPEYNNMPWSMISDDEVLAAVVAPRNAYAAKKWKNGTVFEKAANTIYKAAFENLEDAPFNATDRTFMLNAVNKAHASLKQKGYNDLTVADIQAVLWYYEKRLYGELGARQTADISYEEAARRITAGYASGQGIESFLDDTEAAPEDARATEGEVSPGEAFFQEEFYPDERGAGRVAPAINFEVAPDPNDVALANEWRSLTGQQKYDISQYVLETLLPSILEAYGARGSVSQQVGGYEDDVNVSFALRLEEGNVAELTKLLGFILSQDSMMTFGPDPFEGGSETGAIRIQIGDRQPEEINDIYRKLREIRVDGEQPVGGHSTSNGSMVVLNYSDVDTETLAGLIDQALDQQFTVIEERVYAAFPEKGDYDYASAESDPRGNEGVLREKSRGFRDEAAAILLGQIEKAKGGNLAARREAARSIARQLIQQTPPLGQQGATTQIEPDDYIDPNAIIEVNRVTDKAKFEALRDRMIQAGEWIGRPLLAYKDEQGGVFALTGSHRLAAARVADVSVPVVFVDENTLSHINAIGDQISDVVGTGDEYVLNFLLDAGDERAAALMRAEVEANEEDFTLNQDQRLPPPQGGQQASNRVVRGAFSPSELTIRLTNARDLSTFLHESGHFFLHMLVDLAARPGAPQDLIDDATKALQWMDVEPQDGKTLFDTWLNMSVKDQTFGHEKFARAFEVYLSEGKAPSAELESVFRTFKRWLLKVYEDLIAYARGQNTTFNRAHVTRGEKTGVLNDEIRAVFDRLLASTEEIQNAEAMRSMGMMFATEAEANKFGIDWRAYQSVAQGATEEAVDEMNARSVRQMKWLSNARSRMLRKLQKEADETRRGVRAFVRDELANEPLYRAWAFLTNPIDDPETGGRFSLEELREYERARDAATTGEEAARDRTFVIARLREEGMVAEEGQDGWRPEAVAAIFGFSSADELISKILNSPSPQEAIAARTDERMIRDHSDLNTPEGRNAMVDAALAGELRARMVEIELTALERASKTREPTVAQVARRFAQNMINGMRVRDLRPSQFVGSASRAARESTAAMKKGNVKDAALQKRNQLVNQYAAKYAQDALDEIQAGVRYLRKFERDGVRKNVAVEQLDQIDKLLERFELRRVTNRELDKRQSLAEWIENQRANGIEPDVPEYLLNEISRVNYRSLTVEEFMGLVDSVKQIEHIGRLKKKLLVAKDKREFDEIVSAINSSILQNAGDRRRENRTTTSAQAQALEKLRTFAAAHRKLSSLVYQLDGFKDNGPLWNALVRTANERGDFEATRLAETTKKLAELMAGLQRESRFNKGTWFPTINMSLRWEERIGVALNWGNDGNRQRLLDGRNWNLAKIQPVLDSLSKQDWDFVQAIWDMYESMRPEIGAKERRLFGKEPEWVEAVPVITQYGTYRGGYFPAVYDTRENLQAQKFEEAEYAKRQLQGARAAATTRRNFVKARSQEVKDRPILLTMDAVWRGLTDVIHDLAWHEWLIDANRLMNSERIDSAIRETVGAEIVTQIRSAINDIAAGEATKPHAMDPLLRHMRTGAMVAGLGFNLMNALIQPLGFAQAVVRVGAKWVAQGVVALATDPVAMSRQILEKSEMMRNRARTMNRELNDIRNRVRGKSNVRIAIDQAVFLPMTVMQQMVDLPTWWGAYQKALADMPNNMDPDDAEATAIAVADQAVLASQTGGQIKDLAAIQRGPEALKLFTVFYGYFSGTYNLAVERARATSFKSPAQVARLASDYLLLLCLPAVMTEIIYAAFGGKDDDDEEELAERLAAAQVSYLFGMMIGVRELAGAAQMALGLETKGGAGYGGPAGLRLVQETFRLGQQINQGELDRALIRSGVNVGGIALHLPSGQINRTVDGLIAIAEGRAETPLVLIGGAPPQ